MPAPPREEREEDRMRIMIHDRRREREYVDDGYQGSGSDRGYDRGYDRVRYY
ncbi:hypothetical protein VDGD_04542 [Verticillium dahliae]|nr:hypothetical protein VDGD_04542 [Verticillium dahliae]